MRRRVRYANPTAVRAFGCSLAEQVVGRHAHQLFAVAPGYGKLPLGAADVRGIQARLLTAGGLGVPVELDL